jgi:hypothetical protein
LVLLTSTGAIADIARTARVTDNDLTLRETLLYRGGVVLIVFITARSLSQSYCTSLARFSLLSEVGAMAAA